MVKPRSILHHFTSIITDTMFAYTKLSKTYTKSSKANGKCRILLLLICLPRFYHLLCIRPLTMASASSTKGAAVTGRLRDEAAMNRQKTEAEVTLGEHCKTCRVVRFMDRSKPQLLTLRHITTTWKACARTYFTFRPWCMALATLQTNQ